jgi:serine/threonine protein kinase/Tfp pilus assembly protein PilF
MDHIDRSSDETLAPAAASSLDAQTPAHNHAARFSPGDLIDGRFVVVRFIARGGMGEVYEVEDRQLRGVHVALKTILSQYAADPVMRQRFEREVLNARLVVHPNLCPIYDLGHWRRAEGDLNYLTMKLLPGESLAARVAREGPQPDQDVLTILQQVAAGIAAAHAAGLLHRDIKSANILVQGQGPQLVAWVTDFGLARATSADDTSVTTHGVAGTPGFMAPELFYGSPPTTASDVYSIGVVAYHLLTGRLSRVSLKRGKGSAPALDPAQIPVPWKRFVEGCTRPAVDERFQSVAEAISALPAPAALANAGSARPQRISRRQLILLGAGATSAAALAAWLEWPQITNLLDPLPSARHVALLPLPAEPTPPLLYTVIESIGQRLARAEASVANLLIITPKDRLDPAELIDTPAKAGSSLGANLVLAASLNQTPSTATLNLRLLDAHSERVMRKATVDCALSEISTLAERASREAAQLLQLPGKDVQLSDPEELKSVPPDVYQAYSDAEQLLNQPNHAGLKQSIDKFQHALDLDAHFALAYARLAIAYIRQFYVGKEPANLELAGKNAASALRYNPNSAMALLSQAMVLVCQGKPGDALAYFARAQQTDPGNPEVLFQKAWALEKKGLLPQAEKAYRDILVERPNFWPAYNNLGVLLAQQAKYAEAAKAFAQAGASAPRVAQPMANLAQTYLQMGMHDEARTALTEALARGETEDNYLALGDLDFIDGKYAAALADYSNAARLNPRSHLALRNMGDCYTMLGNAKMSRDCYERAARALSAILQVNPQDGLGWANLAFYNAKIGDRASAEVDIENARAHGDEKNVDLQFMLVQALDVLGKKAEALKLLDWCMNHKLTPTDVDLALDLKDLRATPEYKQILRRLKDNGKASAA